MAIYIVITVIVIAVMVGIYLAVRTKQMEWENNRMQAYMESMEELYAAMKDKIEAVRKYRHDLAKHIQTLEILIAKYKGSEEVKGYVDYMVDQYQQSKNDTYCTDEILNAICELKVKQCEERQIPIEIHVSDDDYSDIKEFDLVGLLHNLLDNAMEANEKIEEQEKRGITMEMKRVENQVHIVVENQLGDSEHLTFNTKKKNRAEHGIGMQIIKSLVEKYNGKQEYRVVKERECLRVEILLNLEATGC